ncbi:hypothetical protein EVAR_7473_1 [Eumeta japonica]|uniref:Uncharacterized protein n=1 Tax=Eumeta variegata TaxID=151549 RepID=A0A4C1Y6N2_EUMVA|nr:hypothetical protein EVAR_7473_1 [Eumeta japonica]
MPINKCTRRDTLAFQRAMYLTSVPQRQRRTRLASDNAVLWSRPPAHRTAPDFGVVAVAGSRVNAITPAKRQYIMITSRNETGSSERDAQSVGVDHISRV